MKRLIHYQGDEHRRGCVSFFSVLLFIPTNENQAGTGGQAIIAIINHSNFIPLKGNYPT